MITLQQWNRWRLWRLWRQAHSPLWLEIVPVAIVCFVAGIWSGIVWTRGGLFLGSPELLGP